MYRTTHENRWYLGKRSEQNQTYRQRLFREQLLRIGVGLWWLLVCVPKLCGAGYWKINYVTNPYFQSNTVYNLDLRLLERFPASLHYFCKSTKTGLDEVNIHLLSPSPNNSQVQTFNNYYTFFKDVFREKIQQQKYVFTPSGENLDGS